LPVTSDSKITKKAMILTIKNTKINHIKAGNSDSKTSVLLLHGASFTSQTWQDLGTIETLANSGYQVIAVDLPGYGKTPPIFGFSPEVFLLKLITELKLDKPIIVSPSMSGNYSLPFIIKYPDQLRGLVAIAPVKIPHYAKLLTGINLPVLAIWGNNDRIVPVKHSDLLTQIMPNVKQIFLENAGHPCYLNKPDQFHKYLIDFIENILKNEANKV
jgi:abhydrolase domain-containing protein 14